jgi:hypothetical protein
MGVIKGREGGRLLKTSSCVVLGRAKVLTYGFCTLRSSRSLRPRIWSVLSSRLVIVPVPDRHYVFALAFVRGVL